MRIILPLLALAVLAGCTGRQSVLAPAGEDARALAALFWVMLAAAVVLWGLVAGLFIYVTQWRGGEISRHWAEALIVGGGVIFPTLLLAGLLIYALPQMSARRGAGDGLRVRITGEQWWWRVEYLAEGSDAPVVSANDVRLPAGRRSELILNADRVIHSFWVPALGGKTDMIPGRENRMTLKPEEPGIYRGQCAEFCGASHALMAFETVVMAPEAFRDWLDHAADGAVSPQTSEARRGARLFASEGCGACHTVRGTEAAGMVGPDLTHVGGRESLGAGILPVTAESFATWIGHTDALKPEVAMPTYEYLGAGQRLDLGHYLEALK